MSKGELIERPVYPFKPGDWVSDASDRVAKVKAVYGHDTGEVLLDLILYAHDGTKVGRDSPACGGPRTFEPACGAENWERVAEPSFPIIPMWVPNAGGGATSRMWAGDRLPPLKWSPPAPRRGRSPAPSDDQLRRALREIAEGHNDPRARAIRALQQQGKEQ